MGSNSIDFIWQGRCAIPVYLENQKCYVKGILCESYVDYIFSNHTPITTRSCEISSDVSIFKGVSKTRYEVRFVKRCVKTKKTSILGYNAQISFFFTRFCHLNNIKSRQSRQVPFSIPRYQTRGIQTKTLYMRAGV